MVLSLFPIEEMKNFCVDSCFRSIIVLFDESRLILFSHINSARDSVGWLLNQLLFLMTQIYLFNIPYSFRFPQQQTTHKQYRYRLLC